MMSHVDIALRVNGKDYCESVEARQNLADFLREKLDLTGTHLGCEHGVCGACTVWIDGAPARSCITLAASCHDSDITSIEGFEKDTLMESLRSAFMVEHGLQCGYCTPGMLMSAHALLLVTPDPTVDEICEAIGGNICRCTGYAQIIESIQLAAERLRGG